MRRLAGTMLYLIAAFVFVYSSAWILFSQKANAVRYVYSSSEEVLAKSKFVIPTSVPTFIPTPTLTPVPTPTPTLAPKPTVAPMMQNNSGGSNSLLDQINAYRASKGLSAASSDSQTCAFAQTRAGEISSNFTHDGFTNRISSHALPYPSFSTVTENIAETSNAGDVVNMWINSPVHAENMQKDTPFICVAQNGNYFAYEGWKP